MWRIRGILRLKYGPGLSERQVAASLALSKTSVGTRPTSERLIALGQAGMARAQDDQRRAGPTFEALGSGLVLGQSRNKTVAASMTAEKKVSGQRSYLVAIETCKINCIKPFAYLKASLCAIANGHPQSCLDDLLPWNFRPSS